MQQRERVPEPQINPFAVGLQQFDTLERIIGNPQSLLYLERFVNRGSYHQFAHYSEVTQKFRPVDGEESFALPFCSLLPDQVTIFAVHPDKRIQNWIIENNRIKFFIHPDMIDVNQQYPERELISSKYLQDSILAKPTSSTRTMMVEVEGLPPFMIKADVEKVISRFMRELDATRVEYSLEISNALQAASETNPDSGIAFLPETLGAYVTFFDGHSLGYLVRELTPRPIIKTDETLIPIFSLFSPNKVNPYADLLLYQVIDNIMRKKQLSDPADTLLQYFLKPCLKSWAYLAYEQGLLPERHAQNALLSLDRDGFPVRIIDRDFQGFNVDLFTRKEHGLSLNFNHHVTEESKRGIVLSRCYDHRMGYQIFDPILEVFEKRYGESAKIRVQKGIVELFHEVTPPEYLRLFPKEQYGADNTTMFADQPWADTVKSQPPSYR